MDLRKRWIKKKKKNHPCSAFVSTVALQQECSSFSLWRFACSLCGFCRNPGFLSQSKNEPYGLVPNSKESLFLITNGLQMCTLDEFNLTMLDLVNNFISLDFMWMYKHFWDLKWPRKQSPIHKVLNCCAVVLNFKERCVSIIAYSSSPSFIFCWFFVLQAMHTSSSEQLLLKSLH